MRPPVVLVVAGLDPCGLSGIAADLRALAALGVHGAPVLSALTDQDGRALRALRPVQAGLIAAQLASVLGELPVAAVKVGLVASAAVARALGRALAARPDLPTVLDPVLSTSGGGELARASDVLELAPRAHVFTPNLDEAAVLLGREVGRVREHPHEAARALLELGPRAVLLKGGHGRGDAAVDLWADAAGVRELALPRVETQNDRGTGCTLASALAVGLARGLSGFDSAWAAKRFVHAALERGRDVHWPHGRGPLAVAPQT